MSGTASAQAQLPEKLRRLLRLSLSRPLLVPSVQIHVQPPAMLSMMIEAVRMTQELTQQLLLLKPMAKMTSKSLLLPSTTVVQAIGQRRQ